MSRVFVENALIFFGIMLFSAGCSQSFGEMSSVFAERLLLFGEMLFLFSGEASVFAGIERSFTGIAPDFSGMTLVFSEMMRVSGKSWSRILESSRVFLENKGLIIGIADLKSLFDLAKGH